MGGPGNKAHGASWRKCGFGGTVRIASLTLSFPRGPKEGLSRNQESFQAKPHLTVPKFPLSQAGMLSLSPKGCPRSTHVSLPPLPSWAEPHHPPWSSWITVTASPLSPGFHTGPCLFNTHYSQSELYKCKSNHVALCSEIFNGST